MGRSGRRRRYCGRPGKRATRKRMMRMLVRWWFCVIDCAVGMLDEVGAITFGSSGGGRTS